MVVSYHKNTLDNHPAADLICSLLPFVKRKENHTMCARTCMFVKFNFCISWLIFMKNVTNLMLNECTPTSWFIRVISPKILEDAEEIYDNTNCRSLGINDDEWKTGIRHCKIWCAHISIHIHFMCVSQHSKILWLCEPFGLYSNKSNGYLTITILKWSEIWRWKFRTNSSEHLPNQFLQ